MKSHIYLSKCTTYDSKQIYRLMHDYFDKTGGLDQWVQPGMNVLLKPNLCLAHSPQKAITTHPVILDQITRILMEKGAHVTIGDNPIGKVEKATAEKIWRLSGIDEVAQKTGCTMTILNEEGIQEKSITIKDKTFSYYVSKKYLNADLVINIPKFKTHVLMGFTGAVKNIYGIVPGRTKVQLHGFAPELEDFARVLVEVYSARVPELTIMDAIEGLEGDGPGIRGKVKKIGTLILSNDGVLVDHISAAIMGIDPTDILTNTRAVEMKLGQDTVSHENVYLNGFDTLVDCFTETYKMPSTVRLRNSKVLEKLFQMRKFSIGINNEKCSVCRLCMENCPVKCINETDENKNKLYVEKSACIQCLCCHEVCPCGAVDVIKSQFYKDLKKIKNRQKEKAGKDTNS
ncbi:MAG: DUF362 domain-containing protein [bacterium]|nr:DUF362 domain-containing protein [bacterium]